MTENNCRYFEDKEMAIYEFDCKKCTNKYYGYQNGKFCEWCKPVVDGTNPFEWEWHDENTKLDTCRCKFQMECLTQEQLRIF